MFPLVRCFNLANESMILYPGPKFAPHSGLKISFTGPSDKMSGDVEFGSDICPMTFSSVLTWK